jgi:hypothetical protein
MKSREGAEYGGRRRGGVKADGGQGEGQAQRPTLFLVLHREVQLELCWQLVF